MVSLSSAKVMITCILIAMAIALFACLAYAGSGLVFITLAFLSLAAIAYLSYVFSDRLLIALTRASPRDVPAAIRSEIEQYCSREHMPVPLVGVLRQNMPDVYVDGIGKRKKALMITSGAISQFSERELTEMAIRELDASKKYRTFDMATIKLVLAPLTRIYERSLNRRYMRNDVTLAGRPGQHATFRKAGDEDLLFIYRTGFDAFHESTGFVPLHSLADRYKKATSIMMIAEYDGQPAGFIIGHIKKGAGRIYGHIDIVAVDARYREKGIGTELTRIFMRALEGYGCLHCCLEVWEHNDRAIKLYEKAGFDKRAIIEDYYKKGQHAQVMCKKLNAFSG